MHLFSYQSFSILIMLFSFIFVPILWGMVFVGTQVVPDARELNVTVMKEIFGKKFRNFTSLENLLQKNFTEEEKSQSMTLGTIFRKRYVSQGKYVP